MCTVTLGRKDDATVITVNRDESRQRGEEHSPQRVGNKIFPIDDLSKGTWCGVNESGLVLSLLNRYDSVDEYPDASRGLIVPKLLEKADIDALDTVLQTMHQTINFAPYILLAVQNNKVIRWDWNGVELISEFLQPINSGWQCVSSSSYKWQEVLDWRYEQFELWKSGAEFDGYIPQFNRLQPKGKEDFAPLVRRENTVTKSITQFVLNGEIDVRYWSQNDILNEVPTKTEKFI